MRVEDLTKLTFEELERIRTKNWNFFNAIILLVISAVTYSVYTFEWMTMFLAIGLFVAGMSLYDNYKIANRVIMAKLR